MGPDAGEAVTVATAAWLTAATVTGFVAGLVMGAVIWCWGYRTGLREPLGRPRIRHRENEEPGWEQAGPTFPYLDE